jgi:hypothetical protein
MDPPKNENDKENSKENQASAAPTTTGDSDWASDSPPAVGAVVSVPPPTPAAAAAVSSHPQQAQELLDQQRIAPTKNRAATTTTSTAAAAVGAVSVKGSLLERVDAKIAAKALRDGGGDDNAKPGAHPEMLQHLEGSVQAKMASSKNNNNNNNSIHALQDSIQAKIRGQDDDTKTGGTTSMDHLEAKIQAKLSRSTTLPCRPSHLENLEHAMEAKLQRTTDTTVGAADDASHKKAAAGVVRTQQQQQQLWAVEADVMAKKADPAARGRVVASSSPDDHHDAIQDLEDAVRNKVLWSQNAAAAAASSSANHHHHHVASSQQKTVLDKDFGALMNQDSRRQISSSNGGGLKDGLETGFLSDVASEISLADHRSGEKGLVRYNNDDLDSEYGIQERSNEEGLAVAVPVDVSEDDGDCFLPAAIEYDPDAKPPMLRNRRFQLYGCLAMVVVVVGIVGVAVGMVLSSTNTAPPLPDRATLGIRETMERLVGKDVFNDATNPYSQALDWIVNVDAMALTPHDHKLMQRFFAAYFYFSTSPWSGECGMPLPNESEECVLSSLTKVVPITHVETAGYRWLSGKNDECLWVGVKCDVDGQLSGIRLRTWYWTSCRIVDSNVAMSNICLAFCLRSWLEPDWYFPRGYRPSTVSAHHLHSP